MAAGSPDKMSITNIETGEGFRCQFNPEEAVLGAEAHYTQHSVPTLSFQPLGFEYTSNVTFDADLTVDGLAPDAIATAFVKNFEAFLWSLLYPPDDADSLESAEPPRVLLAWPGWIALRCKLFSLKEKVRRFGKPPGPPVPTLIVWTLRFVEARRLPIGSESVRTVSLLRG